MTGFAGCLRRVAILLLTAVFLGAGLARAEEPAPAQIKAGDVLCFGEPDEASGFDGRWLVLDAERTNTGEEGMFLVSLSLVGGDGGEPLRFREIGDVSVSFTDRGERYAEAHPGVTAYQGSDLQRWAEHFMETRLSEAERRALIPTTKSDEAIVIPGLGVSLPGAATGTVDFDPAEGVLAGDRLFPLSVAEATNAAYGFGDAHARVALYKGTAAGYWLRSPHIPTFPLDVGFVFPFGAVMDYPVNARSLYAMDTYARPACNLDPSHIAEAERLADADGVTIWRLSMRDGEPNSRTYRLDLPEVGEVMDLAATFRRALWIGGAVIAALLGLIVWLIVRAVRKRRRAR